MLKMPNCFCLIENYAKNFLFCYYSDSSIAQVPKQTDSNATEPETSIDELLGLQVGEGGIIFTQVGKRVCVCLCVLYMYIYS